MGVALQIRVKPPVVEGKKVEQLREMATEMWAQLVALETEKYDFEERSKRQDYDLKDLKEKNRQQLKAKALKFGLDPEALTGNHPPKVKLASKFERRVDTRSFDERKELFRGGWEDEYARMLDEIFEGKQSQWEERTRMKLPRWFGERPGRKPGDLETPEPVEEEIPEIEFIESEPEPESGDEKEAGSKAGSKAGSQAGSKAGSKEGSPVGSKEGSKAEKEGDEGAEEPAAEEPAAEEP